MSALFRFADSSRTFRASLCAKNRTHAPQQTAFLFDHLVGAGEHGRWHVKAKRRITVRLFDHAVNVQQNGRRNLKPQSFDALEVDYEFEFDRLLHG